MGRQIEVLLEGDDYEKLGVLLQRAGDYTILPDRSMKRDFPGLDRLAIPVMGETPLTVYLSARPSAGPLCLAPGFGGNGFSIDVTRSHVIEFFRSFTADGGIRKGRLYFTASYLDNRGKKVKKDAAFVKWAMRVIALVRKNFERLSDTGLYAAPGAALLVKTGKLTVIP